MTYRILFVEDDDAWRMALEAHAEKLPKRHFEAKIVSTAGEAREMTKNYRYHFVSIDQNLPDRPNEFVSSEYGVALCEHLIRSYPLTDRAIYTGVGTISMANKSGRLDNTPYLQKPGASEALNTDSLGAEAYVDWIRNRLERSYHLWTLERAGEVLPAQLAEYSATIGEEWAKGNSAGADWRRALRSLGMLVELTITLTWAQSVALARVAELELPSHAFGSASEKLNALPRFWRPLGQVGMTHPFEKAFGEAGKSKAVGAPARDALSNLLRLRNEEAHGRIPNPDRADLEDHKPHILRLLDALSLWADRPLISGLRYHPGERGRVQFQRHSGRPPEKWDDMNDEFDRLPRAADHVHVLWERDGKPFLADLHPFILLLRNERRRFEPWVLRDYRRDTAVYWSLHGSDSREIKQDEAPDIHDIIRPLLEEPKQGG